MVKEKLKMVKDGVRTFMIEHKKGVITVCVLAGNVIAFYGGCKFSDLVFSHELKKLPDPFMKALGEVISVYNYDPNGKGYTCSIRSIVGGKPVKPTKEVIDFFKQIGDDPDGVLDGLESVSDMIIFDKRYKD